MYPSVQATWRSLTTDIEGEVPYMYLDTKGLVTIGIGNLIDPVSLAERLPFQFKTNNRLGVAAGTPATQAQIAAEWDHIKNNPNRIRLMTLGHLLCAPETNLELSPAGLTAVFGDKTASNEAILARTFPEYITWPADAQLGLMSMAWALGPGFPATWPKFKAACLAQDFDVAAAQCVIPGTGGIAKRNRLNVALFEIGR